MRDYSGLRLDRRDHGVLLVEIVGQSRMNSLSEQDHADLAAIFRDVDADPDVRALVVTGEGRAFCAGGDMELERSLAGDHAKVSSMWRDTRLLVQNIVECDVPVVSAINGAAAGAGLAVALLADISVIGHETVLTDGHTKIGLVAGDHAAIIWPLLCGMARAKRLLMLSERIDGRTAADIGLVSWSTEPNAVLDEAMSVAERLALSSVSAVRGTKRALNHWLRMAVPAFEASLGAEMFGLLGPDFVEGITAFEERRAPNFE
jgi:enoyl-CoA hydratase